MSQPTHNTPATALIHALDHLRNRSLDDELAEFGSEKVPASKVTRHFGFQIGSYYCAVPAGIFCELVVNPELAPLPNTPVLLRGLCNIRGILIPVYSLHELIDSAAPPITRVLLLGRNQDCIGLLIDSLPVSLDLDESQKRPPGDALHIHAFNSLIEGVYPRNGIDWQRFNPGKLGEALLALCQQEQSNGSSQTSSPAN